MLANIKSRKRYVNTLNFILFQAGWFICVIAAAKNYSAVAVLRCAAIIGLHLTLLDDIRAELKLIAVTGCIGFGVDSLHIMLEVFQANSGSALPLAPLWLVTLWMLFAISLRHSLAYLENKPTISSAFAALFAPMAYYAGHKLGAIHLPQSDMVTSLVAIALAWALVTPWLFGLAKWLRSPQTVS